ncbi:cyclopropane-fatty-acyl-phospholipid synthase [Desulfosarcina alkanivorans]|uniref:Cyclopropane-fatty-acyl-phospholipid synthase n=1 Tax=Desulfosarcina alkanivorans TaxID=571177 RepID=A0A5K7YTK0_9BACT|nr:cyclopropane fatty acyl phospholipid synthase [Desulfosarcina alkanivorans]BBO70361.1 cyclopropane-fatty-acyl-phospholipid synthase [Desulfosarcina alkanivorans]
MKKTSPQRLVPELFGSADIVINGTRPWDIQVHNPAFYNRLVAGGSLALGESYMDSWWDCEALDQLFYRILRFRLDQQAARSIKLLWSGIRSAATCSPGRFRAFAIGRRHYDIGNDLFTLMLDKWMNYSCAYWRDAGNLDEAQRSKMDLICRKLQLQPGMRLLDVGCGWGGLAAYAAKRYGVEVTGITVSREQAKLARKRCRGLPVTIEKKDYRRLNGTFDRIVSVGMFEHVGAGRYRTFMRRIRGCLAPEGLFLLHTIAGNRSVRFCDPWISKYIFPNSMLPSGRQIASAAEKLLVMEDWHSFGPDYDPTLLAWHHNFIANWNRIKQAYDGRFFRMWTYYLLACAGSFRARRNQLWQIVFSKEGLRPGYRSVR